MEVEFLDLGYSLNKRHTEGKEVSSLRDLRVNMIKCALKKLTSLFLTCLAHIVDIQSLFVELQLN